MLLENGNRNLYFQYFPKCNTKCALEISLPRHILKNRVSIYGLELFRHSRTVMVIYRSEALIGI